MLVRTARTYGGDLWVAPALGGAARRLAPDANSPAWRPDGKGILYISGPENRRASWRFLPTGGRPARSSSEKSFVRDRPDRLLAGRSLVELRDAARGDIPDAGVGWTSPALLTGFSHSWDGSSRRLYFVTLDAQGGSRVQFAEIDPVEASSGALRQRSAS